MTLTLAKWTIEDYHRMIAAGILSERNVELLKGEIVEMSPEGENYQSQEIFTEGTLSLLSFLDIMINVERLLGS